MRLPFLVPRGLICSTWPAPLVALPTSRAQPRQVWPDVQQMLEGTGR
jgi:hypothetical protein